MAISVMLKPASSACNLKCRYCFYNDVSSVRSNSFCGMMSMKTAENTIKKAFEFAAGTPVYFTFQGGEPLLRGVDFFRDFVSCVKRFNTEKSDVTICVQTNGTLITDEWCAFFAENGILVGVSLDGDEQINSNRVYPNGESSFADVMKGIDLLKKYAVKFNVLSVLTGEAAKNVRQSYRFFKKNSLNYIQYIPCLNPFGSKSGYAMNCDEYLYYLKTVFKLYYNDNMRGIPVSVRQFDNYVLLASGKNAEQCGMNGPCSSQFVVEGDGSVYPCDFYCTDEFFLGNINESDFREFYNSRLSVEFLKNSFKVKDECKSCGYFSLCRSGGCKRNRQSEDYCSAYKSFFAQCHDMILKMR